MTGLAELLWLQHWTRAGEMTRDLTAAEDTVLDTFAVTERHGRVNSPWWFQASRLASIPPVRVYED